MQHMHVRAAYCASKYSTNFKENFRYKPASVNGDEEMPPTNTNTFTAEN